MFVWPCHKARSRPSVAVATGHVLPGTWRPSSCQWSFNTIVTQVQSFVKDYLRLRHHSLINSSIRNNPNISAAVIIISPNMVHSLHVDFIIPHPASLSRVIFTWSIMTAKSRRGIRSPITAGNLSPPNVQTFTYPQFRTNVRSAEGWDCSIRLRL